jgi:hypothetical protein
MTITLEPVDQHGKIRRASGYRDAHGVFPEEAFSVEAFMNGPGRGLFRFDFPVFGPQTVCTRRDGFAGTEAEFQALRQKESHEGMTIPEDDGGELWTPTAAKITI